MMILVPVPYLEGDKQDANHIRVENHHKEGLTHKTVRIDGYSSTRVVRCVSRPDRLRFPQSYLVHLKPLRPNIYKWKLRDLSTYNLLVAFKHRNVSLQQILDSISVPAPYVSLIPGQALIYTKPTVGFVRAKLRNLARKGYLVTNPERLSVGPDDLTRKAHEFLEKF